MRNTLYRLSTAIPLPFRLGAILLCVGAMGCGSGVDDRFAGTWKGTASFTSTGAPSQTQAVTFALSVEDGELLVPSCNGTIHVRGDGRRAHWTGQEVCRAPTASCPSATITTLDYEAVLVGDNRLQTKGINRADGCGVSAEIDGSFDGVRQ